MEEMNIVKEAIEEVKETKSGSKGWMIAAGVAVVAGVTYGARKLWKKKSNKAKNDEVVLDAESAEEIDITENVEVKSEAKGKKKDK